MAEDDLSSNLVRNKQADRDSDPEHPPPLRLDLGDDSSENRLGNQNAGPSGRKTTFHTNLLNLF